MKLGIDFGTTRTVVACADRGNYPVVSFFDGAGDAHDFFPSAIAERGGELRVGFDALAVADDPAFTVVRSFKRFLSDPRAVPRQLVRGRDERDRRWATSSTRFFEALHARRSRRARTCAKKRPTKSDERCASVVAVPANAHGAQRFVTLEAFRRAGFAPVAMLNEPSAAGFEYTHRHRDTLTSKRDHVVVYDLGGGTFDASLVRMHGNRHEVLATAGVNELGGDDFDGVLLALVLANAGVARRDLGPRALERLVDQCRDAKERLNPSSRRIAIDLEHVLETAHPEAVVQVADFYGACMPLVERSIDAMVPVMARLERDAANDARAESDDDRRHLRRRRRQRAPHRRASRAPRSGSGGASIARRIRRPRSRSGSRSACDDAASFEPSPTGTRPHLRRLPREGAAGARDHRCSTRSSRAGTRRSRRGAGEPVRIRRDYRAAHKHVGHFRFFEDAAPSATTAGLAGDMTRLEGTCALPLRRRAWATRG